MVVINIAQQHEFEETVSKNDLVVVHFYAEWAAQCGPMNEVIEELAKQTEYKDVKFVKCPAEDLSEISLKYNITAVPTFLLLRNGKLLDRVDGADAAELTKKINQQVQKARHATSSPEAEVKEDLNTRLQKLINAAPVMLFMKGTAAEPRCGFSKSMVAILDRHDVEYKTFDILTDEEVRQGLKTLSNWPTYPQLYINGELVGGLDIVKEMEGTGELKEMLPKKQPIEERLKLLINKSERMVFMKGCRDVPKCGFSRQLMDILAEAGVEFETYDILRDEEVRQELKKFSNWPTYPQLYVKGELVGGLDIILELKENGDLMKALEIK